MKTRKRHIYLMLYFYNAVPHATEYEQVFLYLIRCMCRKYNVGHWSKPIDHRFLMQSKIEISPRITRGDLNFLYYMIDCHSDQNSRLERSLLINLYQPSLAYFNICRSR